MTSISVSDNSTTIHPHMGNVTQIKIFIGNKLRSRIFEEHDVFIKLQFKTREISSCQSVLCVRYDFVCSENGQQIWMFMFIIPSYLNNIQEYLEEFAHQFLMK